MKGIAEQTLTWWTGLLSNPARLSAWLVRLHNNEQEACDRFLGFAYQYCLGDHEAWYFMHFIAEQERRHSQMVRDLLLQRGIIDHRKPPSRERYWSNALPCVQDQKTAAGIGAFSEQLSLERMRVIIKCPQTPADIREMLQLIEPDESLHAKGLANLAGKHGLDAVRDCHSAGLIELGLKLSSGS